LPKKTHNQNRERYDGMNFSFKWKVEKSNQQPGYLIIARGSSDEFLTS
jgi:hypothetical protein